MRDRFRIWTTLLAAVLQIVVPALGYAGVLGRTAGAEFQTVKTPVVPADYAFSIWSVIFAAGLLYAWEQARPSRRDRSLFRRIGWPMAVAMGVNAAWSVFAQLEYPLLLLFGIFLVGYAASLIAAARLFAETPRADIPWPVGAAVGLQAGWVSVAIFANLSVALADVGYGDTPGRTAQALILLSASAAAACAFAWTTRGPLFYATAVAWALVAVAIANATREAAPLLAAAAGAWLTALVGIVIASRSRSRGPEAVRI